MMSGVTLRSESQAAASWRQEVRGLADIGFARSDGITRLAHLAHHDPLRVLFSRPAAGDVAQATLVNMSGGLIAGDTLDIHFAVGEDAAAMCVASAAEKVCRSDGAECRIIVDLHAAQNAWAEWLPQETIFFDGARLRRTTRLHLCGGARILAGEFLVLGRLASGETVSSGYLRDAWEVRLDGRLIWVDALRMDGNFCAFANAGAGLNGARALATLIFAGAGVTEYLDTARALQQAAGETVLASASCVNGVLVMRWLARHPQELRAELGKFWAAFRHRAAGYPEALPRIWHV
ncbi:MAG: urease accessory protein UreD [Alphaproteobacteria bacterium]